MTDTKHTPGPWTHDQRVVFARFGFADQTIVAECHSWNDALFIASAPNLKAERDQLLATQADLLAALRGLVEGAEECLSHVQRALSPEIAQARAAIARAGGK